MKYLILTHRGEYLQDNDNVNIYFATLEDAYIGLKAELQDINYHAIEDGYIPYEFKAFCRYNKIHDIDDLTEDYRNRHNYLPDLYKQYESTGV